MLTLSPSALQHIRGSTNSGPGISTNELSVISPARRIEDDQLWHRLSGYHDGMKTPVSYDELLVSVGQMAEFPVPWYVSGGWALDLYLNRVTRQHEDLEIGIAREHQSEIQAHFAQRPLFKAVDHSWVPWEKYETLELPVFQVLVGPRGPGEFEFFLNESRGGRWHFRRDESISGPLGELVIINSAGIHILAPEIQLLYKSTTPRTKDESDLATVLPSLEPFRRDRLRELLTAHRPDHPWLDRLGDPAYGRTKIRVFEDGRKVP
jgi:hypothetical protein